MIELICLDVDGTLVGSSGVVSDAVWTAAAAARARGVRLALCSGRPGFGMSRGMAERLDDSGWHIFQNGASVFHLPEYTTRSSFIDPAIVSALVARARLTGRVLELYTDTDFVVEIDNDRTHRHAGLLGVPFTRRDLDSLTVPVVRAQWLLPHADVDTVMAERQAGLTILASTSPVMPDTTFVNMTALGVDKGSAILVVAETYGIPLERVMMVGDGANDVTALEVVGVSVAMGNAEPEAQRVARFTVGSVDQDGVVDAFALAERL